MDFAEKRLIKEKALKKNLRLRLNEARYEFFKDIKAMGGLCKDAGITQERKLQDFKESLHTLNLSYDFKNALHKELNSFIAFMRNYSPSSEEALQEADKIIAAYEKGGVKCAI